MKEATGELNMTVVTVVAIAAVAGLLYAFVWPAIKVQILNNTCASFGEGYHAVKINSNGGNSDSNYACCPEGVNAYTNSCVNTEL